ncbi:histidine phosphatase superfamily [Microdochium trichocladiopsis]|uniref:Histidine phosphatase superfamily n=1 Tax=Microdochium trichocladiopsis TaxID=1682393 RepID=A0A9P8YKP3_9PEZI|nr:histidine phosphatase superfamily [Microdochium trichocladiopsis]KAH7040779.1 histidine phosphatase superfamily [Microdochium trichocladiopsis]
MGRPRLIILIRHAQSEGNKSREIHQTVPDHRVKLTSDGWIQAREAGRRLRAMLRPEDTLQFFTSPYRRTRETTEGILETLTADDPEPSPFPRQNIKVYEEPRLREQDFGNFQPCSAEMERMWQERADYGHFFYRIPNGESAADAYDRVSGFNESLWRQFGEDDFPSVCVLVTHGLMSRVFLMKWYHHTVEYFEDLRNVNHCEFLIMRKMESGSYNLETKLRTWSELRQERAALKAKEEEAAGTKKDGKPEQKVVPAPTPRKWGGCPQGCAHGKHFKIRRDLLELRQYDESCAMQVNAHLTTNGSNGLSTRRAGPRRLMPNNSDEDSDDPRGHIPPEIDVSRARDELVSSPDGTPSYISLEDRLRSTQTPQLKTHYLHVGRDGGGTYSGHASEEEISEREISEEDARRRLASKVERAKNRERSGLNGTKSAAHTARVAHAPRLGDAPNNDDGASDGDASEDELAAVEEEERSVRGSVY